MSGGSYDYAYSKVEDMADSLNSKEHSALRRAFAKHLKLVAKAMHDIEWVDSSDYAKGDEAAAINAVLAGDGKAHEFSILKEDAEQLIKELSKYTV